MQSYSYRRAYSQTAPVREDAQNTEAGGDTLGGVKTADDKTVRQVRSRSGLVVVWYCEEDTEVSGSDGQGSSQTAAVGEDAQNMEAGGDDGKIVKIADGKTVKPNKVRVGGRVAVWRRLAKLSLYGRKGGKSLAGMTGYVVGWMKHVAHAKF